MGARLPKELEPPEQGGLSRLVLGGEGRSVIHAGALSETPAFFWSLRNWMQLMGTGCLCHHTPFRSPELHICSMATSGKHKFSACAQNKVKKKKINLRLPFFLCFTSEYPIPVVSVMERKMLFGLQQMPALNMRVLNVFIQRYAEMVQYFFFRPRHLLREVVTVLTGVMLQSHSEHNPPI